MSEFLSPYAMDKVLEGVIPANQPVRPNWLQSFFTDVDVHYKDTINFDKEFQTKNIPVMYVHPDVDAPLVQFQGFGTQEFTFAYLKEGLASPDYSQINSRQLGGQFGEVNPWVNHLAWMKKALATTEANFETRFEITAASLLVNGGYTASSEFHETVVYNFNRTTVTTDADYLSRYVPSIDLTTLVGNGGAGKRAWGSTGGTKAPTPYQDFITACMTCLRQGGIAGAILSDDAYLALEADITTNYKDAAVTTLSVMNSIELKVLPVIEKYLDVNFRRAISLGNGQIVNVYTYSAGYHDRTTGVFTKYIPDGRMIIVPVANFIKRYGRIKHPKAQYEPMDRYINTWEDAKTGKIESEIHCNFVMGSRNIDRVVSWRVM
jgi:hypothetical protein